LTAQTPLEKWFTDFHIIETKVPGEFCIWKKPDILPGVFYEFWLFRNTFLLSYKLIIKKHRNVL